MMHITECRFWLWPTGLCDDIYKIHDSRILDIYDPYSTAIKFVAWARIAIEAGFSYDEINIAGFTPEATDLDQRLAVEEAAKSKEPENTGWIEDGR